LPFVFPVFFIHAMSLSYFLQFFVSVTNLLLFQFAGQNISTRTDGEDQQISSTHHRTGSSHATNGVAVQSGKRYRIQWTVKYSIYFAQAFYRKMRHIVSYIINYVFVMYDLKYQFCIFVMYILHYFHQYDEGYCKWVWVKAWGLKFGC